MPEPEPPTCEVKIGGAWVPIGAQEAAARFRLDPKRCPVCHGPVMTTSTYVPPIRVRVSHRRGHRGCPLIRRGYCGAPSPHPDALA